MEKDSNKSFFVFGSPVVSPVVSPTLPRRVGSARVGLAEQRVSAEERRRQLGAARQPSRSDIFQSFPLSTTNQVISQTMR